MGQACPETLLLAKYANSQGQANGFCQRVEDGETSAGSQKPLARTGNRHAEQALEENGALFMDLEEIQKLFWGILVDRYVIPQHHAK